MSFICSLRDKLVVFAFALPALSHQETAARDLSVRVSSSPVPKLIATRCERKEAKKPERFCQSWRCGLSLRK
jgi:hypothetical protein